MGIGYDMIIGSDLMIQLGISVDFKHSVIQWDGVTVPMKKLRSLLGKSDSASFKMREVSVKTSEPALIREATERLLKILDSTYAKADLKKIAGNATPLNYEERPQIIWILKDFEDLFDGTLGDWDTEYVDL